MLATNIWKMIDAPWKHESELVGSMAIEHY
jgi:hypothetical protein